MTATAVLAVLVREQDARPVSTVLAVALAAAGLVIMLATASGDARAVRVRRVLAPTVAVLAAVLLVYLAATVQSIGNPAAWRTVFTSADGLGATVGLVAGVVATLALDRGWHRPGLLLGGAGAVVGAVLAIAGAPGPVVLEASAAQGDHQMSVSLEPASTGPGELHVVVSDTSGGLLRYGAITATATGADGTRFTLDLVPVTPGHSVITDLVFPADGEWTIDVAVDMPDPEADLAFATVLDIP